LSLDEPCFLQALAERYDKVLKRLAWRAAEKSDRGERALLRVRSERPRCRRTVTKSRRLMPGMGFLPCRSRPIRISAKFTVALGAGGLVWKIEAYPRPSAAAPQNSNVSRTWIQKKKDRGAAGFVLLGTCS
jgi:hypothetical protein